MISKNLYVQIILRVLLLLAAALFLGWIIFSPTPLILSIIPISILILTFSNIIYYLNRTNRRIFYIFDAIKNEDSTLSFSNNTHSKIENDILKSLLQVNQQIQKIHYQNKKQEQYFQVIIEHAATGIITFNKKGFILHANSQAKQLLGVEVLTHINQLDSINGKLYQTVKEMRAQEQRVIAVNKEKEQVQLLIKSNSLIAEKEELLLLSIQDIKTQLDEQELDSWRKLIRVMMHEIMNSITPISSLSESVAGYFYTNNHLKTPEQIDEKTIATAVRGLEVIQEQGESLINFVESYQKLTRLPEPEKKRFKVQNLIDNIKILSGSFQNSKNIPLISKVEPDNLEILADEKQIYQVLINLIKNAFNAVEKTKDASIQITAELNTNKHLEIKITDNGHGITKELMDKIFIPFFTTKEAGSGIGLSISRQIMQMHGGSLNIVSTPEKTTSAILTF